MSDGVSQYYGNVCNATEWQESMNTGSDPPPTLHCLTRGETVGLTLNAAGAFISLIAVFLVFMLILRNLILKHRTRPLIKEPMDIYMLSLFTASLFQALGGAFDVKWVNDGRLAVGRICTAQGATQQLGNTNVALATLTIAVHTFVVVWFQNPRLEHSLKVACCVVAFNWSFVLLYVIIGTSVHHHKGAYEAPTPTWCWIGENYLAERITGEYMWFWLTLATSIALYIPLHFKYQQSNAADEEDSIGKRQRKRSFAMLAYPLVYCIIILPLSIVRWYQFVHPKKSIPIQASLGTNVIYELSGFLDVMLFLYARPGLLLFSEDVAVGREGRAPSPTTSTTSLAKHEMHQRTQRPTGQLPPEPVGGQWDLV